MSTILETIDLKKYFSTPKGMLHAVDGINLNVDKGETLGIVGESGCGKSTLGRVINHLLEPTSGKIIFEGEDITNPTKAELKNLNMKIQMIFQDPYSSLNPRMTVSQTISEPLLINTGMKREEINKRVEQLMDYVGLAQRLRNTYPHELDGGRRQRIGVARALALTPSLVVCDEPVSALDVSIQAQILNLMMNLQKQMELTYLFITHDLSVVRHISDKIMVMYLGQTVEFSETKNLFRNPLHPYTKALLSAVPIPDIHHKKQRILLEGEITSPINPAPGCRFAARCPHATEICHKENPVFTEIEPGHMVSCHLLGKHN